MSLDVLNIIVMIAVATVVIILAIGIGGYAKGGEFNRKHGNKMMQLRIAAQAVALAVILLAIWVRSQGGQ